MQLTRLAIRRPVTVSMFIVAILLFGFVSLNRLALNLLPDISYPSLTVQTDLEDAAPEEIEALITRPVEEAVGVVSGLTRLSSVSRPGQSEVVLEFTWDADMDLAALDVREKLDLIQLPRDAAKPVILRFDPSFDPIMRLQLYADVSLARLRTAAEQEMKKRLEAVDGVAAVKVVGGREEQIRIEIDEKRLAELGVPITEVTDILRQENLNQAGGSLYDLDANYLVRMLNEFRDVDEIRRIIVRDQGGRRIVLGDVANVWRGVKDRGVIARYNGSESVELAIYKEGDANTVTVAKAVKQRLDDLKKEKTFPSFLNWAIVFNQADFISESVENVLSSAVIGGVLAIVILFVFLRDLRSTVVIGLAIPISIMATFALMFQTGISLNIMSLGGVALGVGMLVDNSIVVLESVDRHKRSFGDVAERVYRGTSEVGMAVTASTLTTVAVFLPMIFVEGIAGQLFTDQALTITYSLIASLLVALTFIPMALAVGMRDDDEAPLAGDAPAHEDAPASGRAQRFARFLFHDVAVVVLRDVRALLGAFGRFVLTALNPGLNAFDRAFRRVSDAYPELLRWSLRNKAAVFVTVGGFAALAALAGSGLGGELIPPLTQGEFSFELKLPESAPLERTDRALRELENEVRTFPEVAAVFSTVGGSQKNQFSTAALEENFGRLYVVMKDKRDRAAEERVIERARALFDRYPDAAHTFSRPTLFSFKTPIEVEIYAFEIEDQRRAADLVARRLARVRGLNDIQSTAELGNPEIQIRFDRARLARLGLEENQVAQVLRNKIRGDVATQYREGDRQIEILVRAGERDRSTVADIENLVVNAPRSQPNAQRQPSGPGVTVAGGAGGSPAAGSTAATGASSAASSTGDSAQTAPNISIRLAQVAEVRSALGPAEIRRIRSQRAAVVSANLSGRDLNSATAEIRRALNEIRGEMPPNATIALGGQNEEWETSYNSLLFAMGLAVFLVYLVMASQFESLVHPFVIMFSVPLALVGVVYALALTGTSVNVVVLLGVIILAGIVVNNAIVLIDYANQLRREGLSKQEALIEAGRVRLRPILMTTLTTVLGLAPMALGWGEGSEIRAPMAVAVMGGLSLSTLLTLILIPVIYDLADRRVLEGDRLAREAPVEPEPDAAWQGAD